MMTTLALCMFVVVLYGVSLLEFARMCSFVLCILGLHEGLLLLFVLERWFVRGHDVAEACTFTLSYTSQLLVMEDMP